MINLIKNLLAPMFSLVLLILGSGLFNTFVPVRLALEGVKNETIGIITSAFYTGYLIGAIRSPSWIFQMNHLRTLILLSSMSGVCIVLQSFWIDPLFWAIVRFANGIAMGGLFVVIESWFLLSSPSNIRSQALSIYLIVLYGALSLAQLFLNFFDPLSSAPFYIAGLFTFIATIPVAFRSFESPHQGKSERVPFFTIFRSSPRGFLGGIISGMVLACIYGLAPVYGQEMGLTIPAIGTFMAMIIFGGLSLQMPLGRLADRGGRRRVLSFACFFSALFSGLIAYSDGTSWSSLLIFSWFFGGFAFVLYPLSMAFACEKIPEDQIVSATGGFVLSYGLGAITGPLFAPIFMTWLGSSGLFYFISGISIFLGIVGILPGFSYEKENNS